MRKLFTISLIVFLTTTLWAQAPQKMSYQAVIRNGGGLIVSNHGVGMQISILKGIDLVPVYVETQTATTNANGLVTIEIGTGAVVSGAFATIDWSADVYSIKTETDPTSAGGTNYTIIGTSQLLSVPYALNAITANSISGGITEIDPIYSGSEAANISATEISKLNNLSGTNTGDQDLTGLATTSAVTAALDLKVDKDAGKGLSTNDFTTAEKAKLADITGTNTGDETNASLKTKLGVTILSGTNTGDQDGSETKVNAGTNVTITGTGTTASPYVVNAAGTAVLSIGQSYQGGIIFWLDATGQHGLIAATTDQSGGERWYNGVFKYTGVTGDGLYAGAMNTAIIVANQMVDNPTGYFAAKICADYSVTVGSLIYGDWYLPSKYELKLLYDQKDHVGGFIDYYWSSCENTSGSAGVQNFVDGVLYNAVKTGTNRVRAIRAF